MGFRRINEVINDFNEVSLKRNINDESMIEKPTRKIRFTEHVADKLVAIYDAPGARNFFLKCAWHLSEDTIWTAVENSRKKTVKSPVKYFVAICSKALRERPING